MDSQNKSLRAPHIDVEELASKLDQLSDAARNFGFFPERLENASRMLRMQSDQIWAKKLEEQDRKDVEEKEISRFLRGCIEEERAHANPDQTRLNILLGLEAKAKNKTDGTEFRPDPSASVHDAIEKIRNQLDVNLSYFSKDDANTLDILQTHVRDQLVEIERLVEK